MKTHNNFDEPFEFAGKVKTWSLVMIAVGVIGVLLGFLTNDGERTFANLLLMGYYFTCVCLAGVFFCAIQYAAQAGWSASLLRIPQAFIKVLPYAIVLLLVIVASGMFITHTGTDEEGHKAVVPYLYKLWAAKGLTTPGSENYDAIIAGKSGFLNKPFFFIRLIGFLVAYAICGRLLVKYSTEEDDMGGMFNYKKSFKISCVFLAIFGFTVPLFSYDTIMTLDAHWFSTMFGWYNLAALWVSGLAVITFFIIMLKKQGYFSWITENHLHNMGILMFAFSIFWTYLWFAQFLLIYYANIPEESVYFYKRWEPEFKPWFWLNIVINFAAPFFLLMSRDAKRLLSRIKMVAIILIIGHWLDYFMMIMPGTVGPQSHWYTEIGWIEPCVFIGFAGLFTFLVLTALSKFKSLAPKNHPLLQESLHHHI
ncbi:quinol:cytochrome C oxidoreductase [Mucilaginibacter segetis]|uniref:Quinol:cytochrome C oxidoreductase n=1 Tax=Mucilaginibacter segetis TaxID=2793071 RepID=A0A934PYE0_9SPHI|nr:quinol:cytochrome C oxidoreductase [Mucilaginibacter segetis]MBK0381298.1 quinol:cytochrome C oxidoreductase [Mucilaginibacter segetis]